MPWNQPPVPPAVPPQPVEPLAVPEPPAAGPGGRTADLTAAPSGLPPRPASGPAGAARRLAIPLATLAGVAAAFAFVGSVDPNQPGHYPVCPSLALTGLYCPACGGLRSAYAVVHGDLAGAVHDNVLAVVGYGVCAVLWVLWAVREARGRPARRPSRPVPPAVWWSLGAVVVAFTVLRNLPCGAALAP